LTLNISGDYFAASAEGRMAERTEEKAPCFIGSKVTVKGSISGNQDLVVQGRVEGRVGLDNRLTVEEEGTVAADVEVTEATVKGELRGDVIATKGAILHPTARVVGSIRAPRLVIEEGAHFSGNIEMDVELPAGIKAAKA
jgi:cytoskeletal protein CcmA (bactofilin family)